MAGQLFVYWNNGFENLEQFLLNMFDFPEVVVVLPRDLEKAKKFAESHGRSVLFVDPEDIDIILRPDFVFHYSRFGNGPEEVANKLKQDFAVMITFGLKKGEPITLEHKLKDSTAAPVITYEVLKLVGGF